jgi:hypothetical protein
MMRFAAIFILALVACQPATEKQNDCASFVNPFMGTGGERYKVSIVDSFSHTHLSFGNL